MMKKFILFSGSSYPEFATELANHINEPLGQLKKTIFPDGEIGIELNENVLRREVFILQSCAIKPNHYLMELMLMIDAAKRAGADEIAAILPYFPYSRQDRLSRVGEPISARVVAEMLEAVGVTRVIAFDLHQGQLEGFFNVPFIHLSAIPTLCERIKQHQFERLMVVAPDAGSAKIARKYAALLGCEFVIIDKYRGPNGIEMRMIGEVQGYDALIVDDICSTGNTLFKAATLCKQLGANHILTSVTHALLVNHALEKLENSPVEHFYVSDTIPCSFKHDKIEVVSVIPILTNGIRAVMDEK